MKNKYAKALNWFEDRIGKSIRREGCSGNFRIQDRKHAIYLFHIQTRCNLNYHD